MMPLLFVRRDVDGHSHYATAELENLDRVIVNAQNANCVCIGLLDRDQVNPQSMFFTAAEARSLAYELLAAADAVERSAA